MTNTNKIQLFLPGIDKGANEYKTLINGTTPPLGLISIATYIKSKIGLKCEIYDGDILTQEKLLQKITTNSIVGISVSGSNYKNSLKLAKIAKNKGNKVVLGGPYCLHLAELILKKYSFIDAICNGQGEDSFLKIIEGVPLSKIENLVMRDKNGNIYNTIQKILPLDKIPTPDFSFVDLKPYFINNRKAFGGTGKQLPLVHAEGCRWRIAKGCLFCAVPFQNGFRIKSPEKLWEEILDLYHSYEINEIWVVSDDFLSESEWFEEFVSLKPKSYTPKLLIFSRVNWIDETRAKQLKLINCKEVFLGVESGNQKMLNNLQKGTTVKQSISAVSNLAKNNINALLFFVFGAPEETKDTLQDTLKLAKKLIKYNNVTTIECDFLNPLPGSQAYTMLMNKFPDNFADKDLFDVEKMNKFWIKNFCNVSYKTILKTISEFEKLIKNVHSPK